MATAEVTKLCSKCQAVLPLADFYRSTRGRHGRRSTCKRCDSAAGQQRYRQDLASSRQRSRESTKRTRARDPAKWANRHRAWKVANAGRWQYLSRRYTLKRVGTTPEAYEAMLKLQNGVCAICGQPETAVDQRGRPRQLAVDHDHATGRIRGLLCGACNVGIGLFQHDPSLLLRAMAYLQAGSA